MIDTVVLYVPKEKVVTADMTYNGVMAWDLQARTRAYDKFVKNPSAKDQNDGSYFPRLTGFKRKNDKLGWVSTIKIEFSVPKLIYNNNLDELDDKQFSTVVNALLDRLARLGVHIERQDLESAEVRAVHYSKNIELTGGYSSQYVIGELSKVNLNKRFDLTKTRFLNDGQSLYFYTKAHSFVVYDKVADLIKKSKRAIDKDQTFYQTSLFAPLKDTREILRLEIRLSEKRKMNNVFKKLGLPENPTFKDAFSVIKSKVVVNHYWDTMIEQNSLLLFSHSLTAKDLLKQILITRKKAKGRTAVYLTGLLLLAREGSGLRELRATLAKRISDRLWYRLRADLVETTDGLNKLKPREWYEQVKQALASYQPFHLPCKE